VNLDKTEEFLNKKMNEDKLIAIAINTDNLDLESKQKTDEPTVDPKFFWQKPKKGEGPALVKDLKSGDEAEDKR